MNDSGVDPDPRLVRIAEAIVEGWTVDWGWEERAHREDAAFLKGLRILHSIATTTRSTNGVAHRQGNDNALGTWGRLELRAKLGEGTFGEVYRAYDSLLDREVALKLARVNDASHTRRFVLEARRLARVRHPNVLVIHGADLLEGRVGIWMDLIEGWTLAEYLAKEGPLGPGEAAWIGTDLCRALAAVHGEGIVHRDLKASNVMREPGGRIVLMDFGSGGELQDGQACLDGHVYGTPLLMAPEQIRGDAVGPQADIYSLGVLLYHAVTGEYPMTAASLLELMERHLHAEQIALRARRPDLPDGFVQVIDRSIHADPRHRFQSAGEMERELSRCIGTEPSPRTVSVAVLPFLSRSASVDDEYFSDGLADELLNVLAKVRGLRVAARTSAFHFKGKNATIADVGNALHVEAVLEGSVRKVGNRARVSVQLVKVSDGHHLWSETYDRPLDDLLAVQDDIAQSVVKELRSTLLGERTDARVQAKAEVTQATKGRAADPEAHRFYLMARYFMDRGTHEAATKAMEYLRRAVDLDPHFALAWAELSRAYAEEAHFGWSPGTSDSWQETGRRWFEEARRAAERALALEPDLAEGHVRMGIIQLRYELDWRGAEASLARARELAPRDAPALRGAGMVARVLGRVEETVRLVREALEQDPLSAPSYQHLGIALEYLDRLAEAEDAFRRSLDLAPQKIITRALLSVTLARQGRHDEALAEARLEPDDVFRLWALAIAHTARGREESDVALRRLVEECGDGAAFQIAEVMSERGETNAAFEWLERARELRDGGLTELKVSPRLRSLHRDPRWGPLLRKMRLEDEGR